MAGKPFKVGRFAHTLRIRLMREHMGVDVDAIEEDQLMSREPVAEADEVETWDPDHEQEDEDDVRQGVTRIKARTAGARLAKTVRSGVSGGKLALVDHGFGLIAVTKGMSNNMRDNILRTADKVIHPVQLIKHGEFAANPENFDGDESERQDFTNDGERTEGFASSIVPTLEEKTIFERRPHASHANGKPLFDLIEEGEAGGEDNAPKEASVDSRVKQNDTVLDADKHASKSGVPKVRGDPGDDEPYGAPSNAVKGDTEVPNKDIDRNDDTDQQRAAITARKTLRKHLQAKIGVSPWTMPTPTPKINPNRFHDPLDETFWKDMWVATAVHNTEIFRKVFRCIPDDLVTTWAAYKAFANHAEKFNRAPEDVAKGGEDEPVKPVHGGPGTQGAGGGGSGGGAVGQGKENGKDGKDAKNGHAKTPSTATGSDHDGSKHSKDTSDGPPTNMADDAADEGGVKAGMENKRDPSGADEAWAQWEREEMEELLNEVRGHLGESQKSTKGTERNKT